MQNYYLWSEVEAGVNFYRDEHDYISKTDAEKILLRSEEHTSELQSQ